MKNREQLINNYITTNFDKFKSTFRSNADSFRRPHLDTTTHREMLKSIEVKIIEDDYYKPNSPIHADHIDCPGDSSYAYNGLGNLEIHCYWDTDLFDVNKVIDVLQMDKNEPFSSWFILPSLDNSVFKFMGIKLYSAFFNITLIHHNNNNDIFEYESPESYESYPWDTVCGGTNIYWSVIETTNLNESGISEYKLSGREFEIMDDGTISVEDKNKQFVKIRLSVPSLGMKINIKDLKPTDNGFVLTSKNGKQQNISMDIVGQTINFVDNGSPDVLDSGNPFKPNIKLTKV